MRRTNTVLFFMLALLMISPGTLLAINSCPDNEGLKECVDTNIESCRESFDCAADNEQALTVSDVTDFIITKCCPRGKRREARCLRRERRRVNKARRNGPAAIKAFLRQIRFEVRQIDCATNTTASF